MRYLVGLLAVLLASPSYAVQIMNSTQVISAIEDKEICMVEVYSPGCGCCAGMIPVVDKFEGQFKGIPCYKIRVEDKPFVDKFGVKGVPTFIIFKSGKLSHQFNGHMSYEEFVQNVFNPEPKSGVLVPSI